jgi:alkylation response protein AidB-like acyl-CoA dehydrogenase
MEMTIARDRWQTNLKTRGQYFKDRARECDQLHETHAAVGANIAALGLRALAEVMEHARSGRLTRHQHILFRLGELIAWAECAGCLCRRAARAADGKLNEKADVRFDAVELAAIARVFAREAALKIASDGLRWVAGAGGASESDMAALQRDLGMSAVHCAQVGLISDMDYVSDALYGRAARRSAVSA